MAGLGIAGMSKRAGFSVLALLVACATGCASRHYYDAAGPTGRNPGDFGRTYEKITITSSDGTLLNGWFLPAVGPAQATVVHFHGKGSAMGAHLPQVAWLPPRGFNVVLFDYRGFGRSTGKPSPKGVQDDAASVLAYVRSRPDVDPGRLLVFGQSLGGAIAITAVVRDGGAGIRGLVTESTLSSYRLMVREEIGKMRGWSVLRGPISWMVTNNRHSPDRHIADVAPIPLLLIHGSADAGVRPHHCRRLFDRANEPKEMWLVEGGGHLDAIEVAGDAYRQRLLEFFERCLASADSTE